MATGLADELWEFTSRLTQAASTGEQPKIASPLNQVELAAAKLARAWSGSNMGYQSRVYYKNFASPPPGAHFDSEWGFLGYFNGTTGEWQEYEFDDVVAEIFRISGVDSLNDPAKAAAAAHDIWTETRSEIISVLTACLTQHEDPLIRQLQVEAEKISDVTEVIAARALAAPTSKPMMIRDTTAFSQGFVAAPHQSVQAKAIAIRSTFLACSSLARVAERAASHLERLETSQRLRGQADRPIGANVFIGHGRSSAWRELKDFIHDRLGLPWDEFNRVPVAGVTNIARLSEMLDNAGIAFIVATSEDEMADGREVARQNVVHEAGLFQGRLGFTRAIILLEVGCDEFSNIQGLGQIRFPSGNIAASFEEVRRVLEREGFATP